MCEHLATQSYHLNKIPMVNGFLFSTFSHACLGVNGKELIRMHN